MFKWLFVNRSIRTKIVWSSAVISLIPMLILSFLFYRSSTRSLEQTLVRSSEQNADYLYSDMDDYFRNFSASALQIYGSGFSRIISLMEHGADYNNAEVLNLRDALVNYYSLVVNKNKDIIKIMIYGENNELKDSWSRASSYGAIRLGPDTPHFPELLDLPFQHSLMFSYREPVINEDLFAYAITIYDPFYRKKFGTMVFFVRQKELAKKIEAVNRAPNVIVLQNAYGETFYRTNGTYKEAESPYRRPETPPAEPARQMKFTGAKDLLVSTAALDNANVGLTILYPASELAQNRQNTLNLIVGAILFVMLVVILCSYLVQRYITKPIQLLGHAMKAVRAGNFHATLKPKRYRDDLSELMRNFNFMTDKIRELIELEYQTQLRNKEAQILALQMQINPHFLYNTLQTIGGKAVLIGDYEIHEMCRALADMFRYSFYEGNTASTIGMELVHVNNYLYIQQLRFEESLTTEFDVPAEFRDAAIIRFVLQPIVENVIVHALERNGGEALVIRATAYREDQSAVIVLSDNGPGIAADKLAAIRQGLNQRSLEIFSGVSIGLKNVHERIRLVYGEPYGLAIESEPGQGTTIRIRIPYEKRGEDHV
ncbi:sensor histidine kinase [Cohnella nanjingensis]|uniref:histidine kinase n=1 Tax=Cohnella nanjingensis TaxID=1387779 RepID=A0A7X0VCN9_9BACL|nr:sensor histidine kinase [Cohnella nanjingensis]MBB6669115.1 sensor histidine kinase [Cohnella nanjingensis]